MYPTVTFEQTVHSILLKRKNPKLLSFGPRVYDPQQEKQHEREVLRVLGVMIAAS